jgi:hypothetical protein
MTPDNDLALRLSAIHQERLRLDDDEAEVVREALAQAHGIVSRAATILGMCGVLRQTGGWCPNLILPVPASV